MRATVKPWTPPRDAAPAAHGPSVAKATVWEPVPSPLLDRRDPLPSARKLVADRYTSQGLTTLHHYRGVFYRWNGSCYQPADRDAVQAVVWSYLEHALHLTEEGTKPFQPNRARVGDVVAALEAACNMPAHIEAPTWLANADDLPPASEFLALENGILHLPSGELLPATSNFFSLNSAGALFDPDAPHPKEWLRFLHQIWPDDPQSIEVLQDIFGLLLSPDTSHQKIFLIVGPKRSGKGTIARVLTALLGQQSVASPTLASLATNFGLAPLIGKTLAIIGDARLSSRADQAAIAERLLSISGEDSLTVDRKFLPAWTGQLGVRFVVLTNELPRLADASGALASRFVVLTMENSFLGREDRGLGNRLNAESSGILNWALEGYRRLRKRGYLDQPESAKDALGELETLGSPVAAFVKESCVVAPGQQCEAGHLFRRWQEWCSLNGRKEAGTAQTFGRDLRAVLPGLRVRNLREHGGRSRFYDGVSPATCGQ